MENDEKPATFCEDLKKFIMTFVSTTAEAIQATQGTGGLMIMSVAIGTKLWEEMERFRECDMPSFETREEKIRCFMNTLKSSGAIGDSSFEEKDGRLVITIRGCFFAPASDRQIENWIKAIKPRCETTARAFKQMGVAMFEDFESEDGPAKK